MVTRFRFLVGTDLLGLKPLAPGGPSGLVTQGLMGFSPSGGASSSKQPPRAHSASDGPPVEEATKKREIRLLKNRYGNNDAGIL